MGKVWMMFESYWRKLPQNEIDGLPKKGVSANAFEAGWKAAQQSVQRTADGACENCGNNCWKLVCETCGAE